MERDAALQEFLHTADEVSLQQLKAWVGEDAFKKLVRAPDSWEAYIAVRKTADTTINFYPTRSIIKLFIGFEIAHMLCTLKEEDAVYAVSINPITLNWIKHQTEAIALTAIETAKKQHCCFGTLRFFSEKVCLGVLDVYHARVAITQIMPNTNKKAQTETVLVKMLQHLHHDYVTTRWRDWLQYSDSFLTFFKHLNGDVTMAVAQEIEKMFHDLWDGADKRDRSYLTQKRMMHLYGLLARIIFRMTDPEAREKMLRLQSELLPRLPGDTPSSGKGTV